jgi:hypothetical protein
MTIRDRPFNLKGEGYGFLVRSKFFFRTTQELEYLFFLSHKARNFFPEFNIRLYDKTLNQIIFFPSTKIRIFFSATLGIRIFFLEKNHTPPPLFKLNGRSLTASGMIKAVRKGKTSELTKP